MDMKRAMAGVTGGTSARHVAVGVMVLLAGLAAVSSAMAQDSTFNAGSDRPGEMLLAQAGEPRPTARQIWRHLPELGIEQAPAGEVAASSRPPEPRRASPGPVRPAAPATTAVATGPRDLAQARLVIHSPASVTSDRVQGQAESLRAAGTAEVEIRRVPFAVSRRHVRFFHAEDREIAQRVAAMVAPGRRVEVADFTHFRPLPRIGTVELWLP